MANTYVAGNLIKVSFTVTNEQLSPPALADPSTISFGFQPPSGPGAIYTWPTGGGQITQDSTGTFHVLLDTTGSAPGNWKIYVNTTGVQSAATWGFQITAPPSIRS